MSDTLSWIEQLQPATYNEVPFVVEGSSYTTGRRVAIHEYPYRDNPWIEDLGLNRRTVSFEGFLVGDDCYDQRDTLKTACEAGGAGVLIHPSMGMKTVALLSAGFSESAERGRVVSIRFEFVVIDEQPRWPTSVDNTQDDISYAVDDLDYASASDFLDSVGDALAQGYQAVQSVTGDIIGVITQVQSAVNQVEGVVRGVIGTVVGFINLAMTPLRDAAAIFNAVKGLAYTLGSVVSLGRFAGNFISNFGSVITGSISSALSPSQYISQNISNIITNCASLRGASMSSFNTLIGLANPLANDTSNFVGAVQAAIESIRANINDPADQIRTLCTLAGYTITPITGDTTAGPTAAVCRRAALSSLALASSQYIPTSQTDALSLIATIKPLFDNEIQYSADNGDMASYMSLRNLRSCVMVDLQTRGSALPPLITITTMDRLPALTLAWSLYADATREPDLCNRNSDVIHPAFFDKTFEALSI